MSIFKSKLFLVMLVVNILIIGWVTWVAGKWALDQPQFFSAYRPQTTKRVAHPIETEITQTVSEIPEKSVVNLAQAAPERPQVRSAPADEGIDTLISEAIEGLMSAGTASDDDFLAALTDETEKAEVTTDHFNKVSVDAPEHTKNQSVLVEDSLDGFADALIREVMHEEDGSDAQYLALLDKEVETRINEMRTIVVVKGDTLWDIAARAYDDGRLYSKIYKANPHIKSADEIYAGMILRVPI